MKYIINPINNTLEVYKLKNKKVYYLSRNIISRIIKLKFSDYFRLKKKVIGSISEFSEDKNMLFHYKFVFDSKLYLIVYCIKQLSADEAIIADGDVLPVQFCINEKYGKKAAQNSITCIIYKIKSSIYLIYSRKKVILYSRIIYEESAPTIKGIIMRDVETLNEDLESNYSCWIISNTSLLKDADFIDKYLEDNVDALSI